MLTRRQRCIVKVQKFLGVKRHKTLENTISDTTCANSPNDFSFDIKSVPCDCGHVPFPTFDHFMGGNKVSDK